MFFDIAKEIFQKTLLEIDAGDAVKRSLTLDGNEIKIADRRFEAPRIYVIALGKAAYPMAAAFNQTAGHLIERGVISGARCGVDLRRLGPRWETFFGGHPLPDDQSIAASRAAIDLLAEADASAALVVFLVSGGGSAMMELPAADVTLGELRKMNHTLVTCGASISEVNSVRRAVSRVKGGGLASRAPRAEQVSLVISDTAAGDISTVASGPSIFPTTDLPDPDAVIQKYGIAPQLPPSVLDAIAWKRMHRTHVQPLIQGSAAVILDNEGMLEHAARISREFGFDVIVDRALIEDEDISSGCRRLIGLLRNRAGRGGKPVCIVSGGEFGCKVIGDGIGGRNLETVLRLAILAEEEMGPPAWCVLSAGTDGIDGNSPAAGAVADANVIARAASAGLDPAIFLANSDSYTFFDRLNTTLLTGPTGTNVRDLRILLAE